MAVSLRPYGVNESAVPLETASDLVAELAGQQKVILGGDFWHIRENRLVLATEPWAIPYKRRGQAWGAYVDGSLNAAQSRLRWAVDHFKDAQERVLVAVQACNEAQYSALLRKYSS
ncbi:MAG TPA: hypothetical protein VFL27_11305 [Candidatus Dormibacteraeota bacterium]|nr:hypothetical protein [Candidatus Dormibacteraeota bacterium]